ncbi:MULTISPECIES: hypothetical protein [unclassified Helicobacter]|uniref:hypothetical protein n=1 Tax=unclassified Helicobacter TaxID=2593540 RepID=UPI0015536CB7|nr:MULTISPECIES: hypothetical protein [unclassified Helicobacter]
MDEIIKEDILLSIAQIQDNLDELESHFDKVDNRNVEAFKAMIEEIRMHLETLQEFQDE